MFSTFLKDMANLRNETRLLEACDWNEDKLALIKEKFS